MVRVVEGRIVEDDGSAENRGVLSYAASQKINFFGFRVPLYVLFVVGVLAALRFGPHGFVMVALVAGLSHFICKDEESSGGGSAGGRRSRRPGSNIRGMDDLPKPPPSS